MGSASEEFSPERAFATVERLSSAALAGRRVGSAGHDRARDWLHGRLQELGADVELSRFSADADVLELVQPPHVIVDGRRRLAHRVEVAEHPRSPSFARVTGTVARLDGDVASAWVALERVPQGQDLDELAARLRRRGAAGILAPQRPFDGYLAKRIVAGPPLALPLLAVSDSLLVSLAGQRLEATLRLRRVRVSGAHVVGAFDGAGQPVLLAAHYDGVGDDPEVRLPGAADNASGAAVVLETARVLARNRRNRPLLVAFLDAEEANALGSRALAADLAADGARALVLNVDLAARVNGAVAVEAGGEARPLLEALDEAGRAFGVPLEIAPVSSDNRRFAGAGFPAVGLGSGAAAYHTPADTPERVEPAALATVGQLVLRAVETLLRKESP